MARSNNWDSFDVPDVIEVHWLDRGKPNGPS
jgi:hypothetical protein